MNNLLRIAAAAVFVCFFLPATSHACCPPLSVDDDIYYDKCGAGRVVVGEVKQECEGAGSSWGVTSVYVEMITTRCSTGAKTYAYSECGTPVSSLDDCIC